MKHPYLSGIISVLIATGIGYFSINQGMARANQEPVHDRTVEINLSTTPKVIPGWQNVNSITK